uniref:DDE Tnp4 domain-containing protein n=1 Tax=Phytophthora ramorum TaxID=164328 RepID=H3G7G5_PHYRM
NARRGFVGMIGSVDCMHWQWGNCPTALAGQHKGKEKKPTKILETVADYNLRIWHCYFGSPGSLNDINVLDQSPLFQDFLQGTAPCVEFVISGKPYDTPYLLADGNYPEWPVFVKPIEKSHGLKQKHFVKRQEACRKDVERCFGVLQAPWRIIDTPCRLWRVDAMAQVMHACIILHNMIIEEELSELYCNEHEHLYDAEALSGGIPVFNTVRPQRPLRSSTVATLISNSHKLHNTNQHARLRSDLTGHLW